MGILRLLLALAVVVAHSPRPSWLQDWVLPGSIAVQAFYVISGFYMALVLNEKYTFPGSTSLFYQQRYLRLAPMYWLTLLITVGACAFYSLIGHRPAGKFEIWAEQGGNLSLVSLLTLIFSQVSMFGLDAMMFCGLAGDPLSLTPSTAGWMGQQLPATRFLLVPPAWSLSVELLFYLVAPFIVRRSIKVQATIIAATFALRILAATALGMSEDPWDNRFFPFEAGIFLLGSLAYRTLPVVEKIIASRRSIYGIALASLILAMLSFRQIPLPESVRHWGFVTLMSLSVPLLFAATKRNVFDRWIGELSYPLYLLHQVIFFAAGPVFRRVDGVLLEIALIVVPVAVTVVCYFLFERPFEAWRARLFSRRTQPSKLTGEPASLHAK